MAKVEPEFRAAVVNPTRPNGNARLPIGQSHDPQLYIPRDSRHLTRGTRSTLRWSETPPGKDQQGDRLEFSSDSRRQHSRTADPQLDEAQQTLGDVLEELKRRGLADHPRARALSALRDRLNLSQPAPEPTAAASAPPTGWQSVKDEAADLYEALLGLVQSPAGRQSRKRLLLAKVRQAGATGDAAGERRLLRRVLVNDPADPTAHSRLGRLYLQAGQYDQAEPHLGAAAASLPKDPAAHIALGQLHYHRKDPDAAIMAFGRALRLNPDHSDANAWLGIMAYDAQRPVEAQRFLERAIALDPNNAVARYYVAQLSLANGDTLRANFQLSVVRKLEPQAELSSGAAGSPALPSGTRSPAYTGWLMPKESSRLAGQRA